MTQVSIITITQHSRFPCLQNLYHIIQRQQYLQIQEWVIVEGSQNIELRNENACKIQEFINTHEELTDITMRLIVPDTILHLSDLRNIGNDNCKGDIIVCMDDDDYYPPTRISHAVLMLNRYDRLIAGCSAMYMYDYDIDKLYKFRGYHNNHSTNNCMAYKKAYLKNHRYKEGCNMAEEYSFTKGFTEPMIQLNAEKCIIVSSHNTNTVDKKQLIDEYHLSEINNKQILHMIPQDIYNRMKEIFAVEIKHP